MPAVSVVMPVYNREKYVAEAIESILGQTFADFELIIVDDCSNDRSPDIIREYQQRDARINLIQLRQNEGPGSARNHGIRASAGAYIAGMDSDDVSLPERLRRQVEILEANPDIGAVGVGTRTVHKDLSPRVAYCVPGHHAIIALEMLTGGVGIVRASLMFRRRFLVSSGGYNTHRGYYVSSDSELTQRLLCDMGIRFANVTEVLYLYRLHGSNISSAVREPRDSHWLLRRALERLWGEAPAETMERLTKANLPIKLNWHERRLARRDYKRLVDDMAAANWIDADDINCLHSEIKRRLESKTPRLWQMFCHWRRHRFGGQKS